MQRLTVQRLAKIAMVAALGAFGLLVAVNNLVDYGSNFAFVQHVLSMDTTFPGNALMGRAVHARWAWHAAYLGIIAGEAATGVLYLAATAQMVRALGRVDDVFSASKHLVPVGTALGFMVWFFGFEVVGGEWFGMWQSHQWNGQEAAFRFFVAMLGVCIHVMQAE